VQWARSARGNEFWDLAIRSWNDSSPGYYRPVGEWTEPIRRDLNTVDENETADDETKERVDSVANRERKEVNTP
jgi:hypothetical protein